MADLRPVGSSRPVELVFEYEVDDAWIERMIVREGRRPPKAWRLTVDLAEDVKHPAEREVLYRLHAAYAAAGNVMTLPEPTADWGLYAERLSRWLEKQPGAPPRGKAAFEREMKKWIARHGSERLARAAERGYKVNRLYATERAAIEFPPCWVDAGEAEWRERTDPSAAALELETSVTAHIASARPEDALTVRIVWLTEPPRELSERLVEMDELFENQEALVIGSYLGRYRLVCPVDSRYRRNSEASS